MESNIFVGCKNDECWLRIHCYRWTRARETTPDQYADFYPSSISGRGFSCAGFLSYMDGQIITDRYEKLLSTCMQVKKAYDTTSFYPIAPDYEKEIKRLFELISVYKEGENA